MLRKSVFCCITLLRKSAELFVVHRVVFLCCIEYLAMCKSAEFIVVHCDVQVITHVIASIGYIVSCCTL